MLDVIVLSVSRPFVTRLRIVPRVPRPGRPTRHLVRIVWSNDPDVVRYQNMKLYITDQELGNLFNSAVHRLPMDGTAGILGMLIGHIASVAGVKPEQTLVVYGRLSVVQGPDGENYVYLVPEASQSSELCIFVDPVPTAPRLTALVTEYGKSEYRITVLSSNYPQGFLDPVVWARREYFVLDSATIVQDELPGLRLRLRVVLGKLVPEARSADGRQYVRFVEFLPRDLFYRLAAGLRLVMSLTRLTEDEVRDLVRKYAPELSELLESYRDSVMYWRDRAVITEQTYRQIIAELEKHGYEIPARLVSAYLEGRRALFEYAYETGLPPLLYPYLMPLPPRKPEAKAEEKRVEEVFQRLKQEQTRQQT